MPITVPTVNISEFTRDVTKEDIKHTVSGDGIFDDMMETATKHLQAQFEGNRIRGEMYAQAYIQIYIETLRTAMQIWLQKPEQDAKVALLEAQKENTEAQTLLLGAQKANVEADTLLKGAQKNNTEADTLLKGAQKDNIVADTQLKGSQKLLTDAQKILITNQAAHELAKQANTEADTLLKGAQKLLIDAQKALTTAQAAHEPSKKLNTEADTLLKQAQKEYISAQKTAALKDEALKVAQTKSENMKTSLYKRQIEGYDENYKEKILKIILDAFTVVFSVASEGFKGGVPKVITVSGINKICDIITKDLNIPAGNSENASTWVEKVRNDPNATVPDSYSTAGWDENA